MTEIGPLLIIAAAGLTGGAMNALAGGGTFATLPALIAVGLPANIANATSNVSLLPGAGASAWGFRAELAPIGGVRWQALTVVTFFAGLVGAALLVLTPTRAFDLIIPWLLLFALLAMLAGKRAADWLAARVTIGPRTLVTVQALLGVYGGYFGGGVGLMATALYGLLAGMSPRAMFAPRTLMLGVANSAAAIVFIVAGMVRWPYAAPMLIGALIGGWGGAIVGRRLPPTLVRIWTLLVTATTTAVFFVRAYG